MVLADLFAPFLAARGVVVVDGALATELERRGADLSDTLWSARVLLEQPALIRAVHDDYFAAGADVAITSTYQATFEGLARRGLDAAQAAALMRTSVQLAIESRDAFWAVEANRAGRARPLVAASVGPYGAFLADGSEYRGDYALDEEALSAWHRPRFELLADCGADLLACETIPCAAEARALRRLLHAAPAARAWFSFSARDGVHLSSGERFADVVAEMGQRSAGGGGGHQLHGTGACGFAGRCGACGHGAADRRLSELRRAVGRGRATLGGGVTTA